MATLRVAWEFAYSRRLSPPKHKTRQNGSSALHQTKLVDCEVFLKQSKCRHSSDCGSSRKHISRHMTPRSLLASLVASSSSQQMDLIFAEAISSPTHPQACSSRLQQSKVMPPLSLRYKRVLRFWYSISRSGIQSLQACHLILGKRLAKVIPKGSFEFRETEL
jgi:hypothetical protein